MTLDQVQGSVHAYVTSDVGVAKPGVWLQEAAILGLLSFVMSLVVLIFFSSVLLNVVDAVFMCYAMDLDTQSVTKSEVHEVFSQVRPTNRLHAPAVLYMQNHPVCT